MASYINLHTHSSCSDGTLPPERLAVEAKKAGISYFSLTDHDVTAGWPRLEPELKKAGISYCYGVEISTKLHDSLHILGYGVNPVDPGLLASLAEFRARRVRRVKEILGKLETLGMKMDFADLEATGSDTLGRPHIADLMVKKGFAKNRKQAFEQNLAWGKPAYVNPNGPDIQEAIGAVTKAGGLAVLAHPGVVFKVMDLPAWKDMGLGGIEAFYPCHTNTAIRAFVAQAERYGLLVTAGTDFHGPGSGRDDMKGYEYKEELFGPLKKYFI